MTPEKETWLGTDLKAFTIQFPRYQGHLSVLTLPTLHKVRVIPIRHLFALQFPHFDKGEAEHRQVLGLVALGLVGWLAG